MESTNPKRRPVLKIDGVPVPGDVYTSIGTVDGHTGQIGFQIAFTHGRRPVQLVALTQTQVCKLLADITVQGAAANREFPHELAAAIEDGMERLRKGAAA